MTPTAAEMQRPRSISARTARKFLYLQPYGETWTPKLVLTEPRAALTKPRVPPGRSLLPGPDDALPAPDLVALTQNDGSAGTHWSAAPC